MLVGLRSRKHIAPFELVRPKSLDALCRAYAEPGRSAVMAGGLDLIDRMKSGEAFERIIHLAGVRELAGIRREGEAISIGALATHAELAGDALLSEAVPDLPALWRTIANPRVRYAGTIGGNLMSAMPHYDAMPALLALGAEAVVVDHAGASSRVELSALRDRGDILARIVIRGDRRVLLADRSLHPIVSVYLGVEIEAGRISSARLAIGCAYAQASFVTLPLGGIAVAAAGADAAALARTAAASLPEPTGDGLASTSYRRRMIEVLARRLLIKLGSRA